MDKRDASDPFEQLNAEEKQAAIDTAIAVIVIGLRIHTAGQQFYDYIASEFSRSRSLPANVVKYALRNLGMGLLTQNWTLTIEKDGQGITTKFTPEKKGGNGEKEVGV